MLKLVAARGISVATNAFSGLGENGELVRVAGSGGVRGKGIIVMDAVQIEKEKERVGSGRGSVLRWCGRRAGGKERKKAHAVSMFCVSRAYIYSNSHPSKKIEQKIYQRIEETNLGYSRKPTPQSTNLPTPIYKPQSTNQAASPL